MDDVARRHFMLALAQLEADVQAWVLLDEVTLWQRAPALEHELRAVADMIGSARRLAAAHARDERYDGAGVAR